MTMLAKVPLPVWVGLLAFAGYAAWALLSPVWSQRRTRSWSVAAGRVVEAVVGSDAGVAVDVWSVRLDYAYEAAGAERRGVYRINCVTAALADQAAASLREAELSVHYDPRRPVV